MHGATHIKIMLAYFVYFSYSCTCVFAQELSNKLTESHETGCKTYAAKANTLDVSNNLRRHCYKWSRRAFRFLTVITNLNGKIPSRVARQKASCILWNFYVSCCIHKSTWFVSTLAPFILFLVIPACYSIFPTKLWISLLPHTCKQRVLKFSGRSFKNTILLRYFSFIWCETAWRVWRFYLSVVFMALAGGSLHFAVRKVGNWLDC
jgi:hypothetical protein